MTVLRVVDRRVGDLRRVAVSWQGPGRAPRDCEVSFRLGVDDAESEKVRWYLEDYAEFPADPAPLVAADAESVLSTVGQVLFQRVFGDGDAAALWTLATAGSPGLAGLRVEVDADPADVPGLPWELLREPSSGRPVALEASEFVRTHRRTARQVDLPRPGGDRLRVLLVICRPGGRDDVPFRSVASKLVRGGAEQMPGLDLDVLRPPTFERLAQVLRGAAAAGVPYHVVHFDGHGAFLDARDVEDGTGDPDTAAAPGGVAVWPLKLAGSGPVRAGRHGYLLFEDPESASNQRLVDGPSLAALLVDTQVPVLVLNACRSAYAEAPAPTSPDTAADPEPDVHERIRAYGSLAAEVADAGVPGVVAMRYNVYVITAAQFVANLYAHLVAGKTLGLAATSARKALAANSTRQVGAHPVSLQDWVVPTVYEAIPLQLLASASAGAAAPLIRFGTPGTDTAGRGSSVDVPGAPDVGFFGRDETLLALDRAFDAHQVVLLHAFAGAGKTTTAAEFTRWYTATGGLRHPELGTGPVLWTSFEHHTPLNRVLDAFGNHFAGRLEANNIHWAAITDQADRRDVALQLLAQVALLWVWDNVEPVAGFPAGTPSVWTAEEQRDLGRFLHDLNTKTRTRVLLTSRRTETDSAWLGGLPVRVMLPPMPMREGLRLIHALVRQLTPHNAPGGGGGVDWRELLRFAAGNPLTITVAGRQAMREDVAATREVGEFVTRLRAGLAQLEDFRDAELGRDRSLAASLDYGFTHAFTDAEQAQLALLHLFRDTVATNALCLMGDPAIAGADAVPALAGADRDTLAALLDRAVQVGLLTDYGGGFYGIHPALPWYFTALFSQHHGTPGASIATAAERAYTHAHAAFGSFSFGEVQDSRANWVLHALRVQEGNLTHGLALARTHHLHSTAVSCLQGLRVLYILTGRDTEWTRLVADIQGDYIDPATDQPLPDRDDDYPIIAEYRVQIARDRRDWPTATRLHTALIIWNRQQAGPHVDTPADQLDPTARNQIRTLALSECILGGLLLDQGDPSCVDHFGTAYTLARKIGDTGTQTVCASGLGNAYLSVSGLRDLDQAQRWHQRDLDLTPVHDRIGQAATHGNLANIAYERFRGARRAGAPDAELLAHLKAARASQEQALDLLPIDNHHYVGNTHASLGILYSEAGDVPQALHHFQEAIRHREICGDTYRAGHNRFSIGLLLREAGRPGDALHYARAARTNFRTVGPGAATDTAEAGRLILALERDIHLEEPCVDASGHPQPDRTVDRGFSVTGRSPQSPSADRASLRRWYSRLWPRQ